MDPGLEQILKRTIDWDEVIGIIADFCEPEDVFSTQKLEQWAKENGYIHYVQRE